MKFAARFLFAGAVLLAGLSASSKASGQAQAAATGPGSYISVGGMGSFFHEDYGKQYIYGPGAFLDINPTWRYGIEAEARFLRYGTDEAITLPNGTTSQLTEDHYLIGPRVAIRPGPLRPYVKFMVGAGHVVLPYNYAAGNIFALVPGGGVEYLLGDRWAVRVVDFEYQLWQNATVSGGSGSYRITLRPYGVSAGISFRVNGLSRYPKDARRFRKNR